jgi:hypothetical protein
VAANIVSGSGNNALLTVDAVSNAARNTWYDSEGNEIKNWEPDELALNDVSVVNNDLLSINATRYKFASIQLTGTWVGTVKFQVSNTDGDYFDISGQVPDGLETPFVTELTANAAIKVPTPFKFLRIRCTAISSGTISGVVVLHKEENSTGQISATGQVTLADSAGAVAGPMLTDSSGANHLPVGIIQDVLISTLNSTTVHLEAGQVFFGSAETTKGVNSIDLSAESSEDLTIEIQQSHDGTNWDHIDIYLLAAGTMVHRNFKALAIYYRIKVTNTGASTTTVFHVYTALTPVSEVLPGALTQAGNLKTAIEESLPAGTNYLGKVATVKDPDESLIPDLYVSTGVGGVNANSRVMRAQACALKAIVLTNYTATPRHVKLYDTATAPVAGVGVPKLVLSLPAAGSLPFFLPDGGFPFVNGIGMTMVLGAANDNATGSATEADISLSSLFT